MASKPVASLCLIERIKNNYFQYLKQSIRRNFFQIRYFTQRKVWLNGSTGDTRVKRSHFDWNKEIPFCNLVCMMNEKSMVPDIEHEEYYPDQVFQFPAIPDIIYAVSSLQ